MVTKTTVYYLCFHVYLAPPQSWLRRRSAHWKLGPGGRAVFPSCGVCQHRQQAAALRAFFIMKTFAQTKSDE